MPIISIHEEVAIKLAKQHKNLDTKDFYLGTLAPDTVNLNYGFAPKELRWTAHQRRKDLSDWKFSLKDLKKFFVILLSSFFTILSET